MKKMSYHPNQTPAGSRRASAIRRVCRTICGGLILVTQLQLAQGEIIKSSPMIGLTTGNLGAVGAAEGWAGSSGNYTVTSGSGSLDGTSLGLVVSTGDKAEVNAGTASLNTYNNFAASGQFPRDSDTNIYYSFLVRFNNINDVDPAGETVTQVNRLNSSSGVHFNMSARSSAGKIQLGITKIGGATVYSTTNLDAGVVAFVVLRQHILPGDSNNIVDIWINPPAGSFGLDEASIPPSAAVTSDGGDDYSSTAGPARFYLIAGPNFTFDELRVATTWGEATPTPALCFNAEVTSDPVDATVVAGINTSFSVTGNGTSPSYRWQLSTNAGSSWTNISGAVGATYKTPNLALSDNGKQFRCIVSVSCNGSSATSAVATVTVQAPVVTPPGLIMDDDWSDLDRTTGPITTNNSIWYASAAGSMTFSYVPGSLFGLPASGSSRLWIGYFNDDTTTNLPVDLAVGTSLKVTWVWNSDVIGTSGGGLRLGLFDYADGGTRVTADGFGSGSTGNGNGVRGYMMVVDYASTFPDATPFELRARTVIDDNNLMGSTGNYPVLLGSGPSVISGAPAFQNLTNYTLVMQITRTAQNSVDINTSISGGGTNWTLNATDNTYAYHRFDAFAIRPNSSETTAADFEFVSFKVEVAQATPAAIPLNIEKSGSQVTLTWSNAAFGLQAAPAALGTYTNIPGATSPYAVSAGEAGRFFRLKYPNP